eukprot:CAMPEP_0194357594 /NCGR_PEP_ID=MMETSP0174-20130528/5052_1 /TAXON_ID=216777 /ORGANISM="Proboscia alata, Strain PI-D3" /LENGTH=728 /DNA_ID=CAMNT_0039127681 /DNA_START=354 /DNA_END=2540 /DNA_ORIENTATION=+
MPIRDPSWKKQSSNLFVAELDKVDVTELEKLDVSELEKLDAAKLEELVNSINAKSIPGALRIKSNKNKSVEPIPTNIYESTLIQSWENDPTKQKGFDWEIEKMRRYFAGLRMRDDGSWVRQDSFFGFLVSKTPTRFSNAPLPVTFIDVAKLFTMTFLSSLGFGPSLGLAAVPDAVIEKYEGSFFTFIKGVLGGDLQTLAGGPLFLLLAKYYEVHGPIFNLSFGPKSFLIVSDPVMAKHILKSSPENYCKGVLADVLEPIMGNGLIPADPKIWKVRRRAIVPCFHKRWLNRMVNLFGNCADVLNADLEKHAEQKTAVDMEERFASVALDIIGQSVFNYDFGSVTKESPVVKAVYRVLREVEHRSVSFIPYWNLPYADKWMGGQVEFSNDMNLLDDILTTLINRAVLTRQEATAEELEERDNSDDPSLLRFLCDMRGEDISSKVLRDDLMTMLIAGHETTAAVLTWTLFELSQGDAGMIRDVQAEIRSVLGDKERPDYEDVAKMPRLLNSLVESLRLYPEPPILIRRARHEDVLPEGGTGLSGGVKILRGTDIFISTWNLHRSPELWENSLKYDPTRWERSFDNPGIKEWKGFNPDKIAGLYASETATDFAFLPFGGGQRKCVGDQFAMLEAAVTMSMLLNKYDFCFKGSPEDVGMQTGATIHTMNGLNMYLTKRDLNEPSPPSGWWEQQHLSRGLDQTGKPFKSSEEAAWQVSSLSPKVESVAEAECEI